MNYSDYDEPMDDKDKHIAELEEELADANGQVDLYKQRIQQLYASIEALMEKHK
jgi:prefoldin subunit 5